jgi:hypothetical protein
MYFRDCKTLSVFERVNTAKYLGITLSSNMSWDTHINNITAKANKFLSFLHRNLQIKREETKSLAYKSMVRSNLECKMLEFLVCMMGCFTR